MIKEARVKVELDAVEDDVIVVAATTVPQTVIMSMKSGANTASKDITMDQVIELRDGLTDFIDYFFTEE